MTSQLRWQLLCAISLVAASVSVACTKAVGDTTVVASKAKQLQPIAGLYAVRYQVNMCAQMIGKTVVTNETYEAAYTEAVAQAKAIHDSIGASRGIVDAGRGMMAPGGAKKAASNAAKAGTKNPPLMMAALQGATVMARSSEPLAEKRRDSLVNLSHAFEGSVDANIKHFFPANVTHDRACGSIAMPEVQDVQRLINADGSYGPQVQLIAMPGVALPRPADFDTGYVLVALAGVQQDTAPMKDWYPMSTGYTHLNLAYGTNCVFLRHQNAALHAGSGRGGGRAGPTSAPTLATVSKWDAIIGPATGMLCDARSIADGKPFDVAVFGDSPLDSIPPATRFIEGKDQMSHVAVKCAMAWCVIGPAPLTVLQPAAHAVAFGEPGAPKQNRRTQDALWFDEQHLAIDDATIKGKMVPSFRASIVPDTGLQNPARNYKDKWYPVAYVYAPTEPPRKYQVKFNFQQGWNEIRMRQIDGIWFSVIINKKGDAHVQEVLPMEHTFGEVPGTVRWDWMETDDWIWVPCLEGCCLIQDGRDALI